MVTPREIEATQETISELVDALDHIFRYATSDDWKNNYVEEMGNFHEIKEKLNELGYEPTGEKR